MRNLAISHSFCILQTICTANYLPRAQSRNLRKISLSRLYLSLCTHRQPGRLGGWIRSSRGHSQKQHKPLRTAPKKAMAKGLDTVMGRVRPRVRAAVVPRRAMPAVRMRAPAVPAAARLALESTVALSGLVLLAAWMTRAVVTRVRALDGPRATPATRRLAARFEDGLLAFESFHMSAI